MLQCLTCSIATTVRCRRAASASIQARTREPARPRPGRPLLRHIAPLEGIEVRIEDGPVAFILEP